MKTYKIEPNASSILGSLRSIGYDLKTALADIIDNSISANAQNIEIINNDLKEENSRLDWLAIVDNGFGMTMEKMVEAFTLGSGGIDVVRNGKNDLGRFGLGLKTATFSQCEKLTVISKTKEDKIVSLVYDLDFIVRNNNKWEAYTLEDTSLIIEKIKPRLYDKEIFNNESWTIVFWENIDKINFENTKTYNTEINKVRDHFSLVYHKYINELEIRINNTKIDYWNPFLTANSSEKKEYKFDSKGNQYSIRTHILKHSSEFINYTDYSNQSKIGSFTQNQGFFVYRNKRLVYHGSWLGLFYKEHHYILARVEINLPNTYESDIAWEVNISKSTVRIPSFTFPDIISECNHVRAEANNTFRFHGGIKKHIIKSKKTFTEVKPIWEFESKGNSEGIKDYYKINQDHPIIKQYIETTINDSRQKEQFKLLLKYLESYLPLDNIFARKASQIEIEQPRQENQDIYEKFKAVFELFKNEMDPVDAFETLIYTEPFDKLEFNEDKLKELGVIKK
jgi:hypothetical protein